MTDPKLEKLFLEAYDMHADEIFRYCYFKLSDRDRAKDATQEVFMKVWKYLSEGKEITYVRAFLFKVASNYVKDQWKKKKALPMSILQSSDDEEPFDVADPDESALTETEYRLALRLFEKLSDEDRILLQLRFVEDKAVKDIAETLGERENTIAVRLSRALARLRNHLNKVNP